MEVHVPQGKGLFLAWFLVFFGICARIRLNGRNDVLIAEKYIRIVCEKLTVFPYRQYRLLLNSMYDWVFDDIIRFKIEVWVEEKIMYRNVTLNTRKMAMPAASLRRNDAIIMTYIMLHA